MRHQLTIRVMFDDTADDADGRRKARDWLKQWSTEVGKLASDGGTTVKLQRLTNYGPPQPVALGGIIVQETEEASHGVLPKKPVP